MFRYLSLYFSFFVITSIAYGQPTICEAPFEMTPFCNEACIICDIDGFQGRHDSNVRGEAPPDFCVFGVENAQWIAFLAGSETLEVDISVSNCDNFFLFSGLQMAIYESLDCETFTQKSNCIGGFFQIRQGQTGTLFMNDLTVGQYYYLVMDGSAGDNCDWTMSVQSGTTEVAPLDSTGTIIVQDSYCSNDTIVVDIDREIGATEFLWELNQDTVAMTQSWDTLLASGTYEVCVTGSNACNVGPTVCDTIEVLNLLRDTVSVEICESSCTTVGDSVICNQGIYDILVSATGIGCDTIRRVIVEVVPNLQFTIDTTLCSGLCIEVFDTTICEAGLFLLDRQGSGGDCDSSIVIQVREADNIRVELSFDICEGTCATLSDTLLCELGFWEFDRAASIGCDTTYAVTVTVRDTTLGRVDTMLCPGDFITIDGADFTMPAVYDQVRSGVNGCDSIIRWTISESMLDTIVENYVICGGDSLMIDDIVVIESGQYFTMRAGTPCSLAVVSQVDVLVNDTTATSQTLCFSDTLRIGNQAFAEAGTYLVELVGQGGCDSIVELTLEDQLLPFNILATSFVCEGDSILIGGEVYTQSASDTVSFPRTGACDSLVIINVVSVDCEIVLLRNVTPVGCDGVDGGEIDMVWGGGLPSYTIQLLQNGTVIREEFSVPPSFFSFVDVLPGEYQVRVIDRLGNTAILDATILEPVPLEIDILTSDYTGFGISCDGATDGSIEVSAVTSNGPIEVVYGNGVAGPIIDNLAAGTYTIMVTDSVGCTIDTSITLQSPDLPEIDLFVQELPCSTDTAALVFGSVFSQLPVTSLLYNGEETNDAVGVWAVPQDMQGLQVFSVVDSNGCTGSDSVMVDVPSASIFTIVDTVNITQGDSIDILLEWADEIATIVWSATGLSCADCLAPVVGSAAGQVVTVEVVDLIGCTSTYAVVLIVEEQPPVVLANIFSPNGDSVNDEWEVAHPSIQQVIRMAVYDRWGSLVHEQRVPDLSGRWVWDGLYRGRLASTGVYVYQLEYLSVTTRQRAVTTGTITLIR